MRPSRLFKQRRNSGIAIVLVLSILVLLTAVVVAFFTNATTDATASKSYSDSVNVKLLANSAVNLVEGQIRAASLGYVGLNSPEGVAGATEGSPLAWASQPGAIRTYDNTGSIQAAYKLYSSDEMVVTKGDADGEFPFNPAATATMNQDVPSGQNGWNTLPSDFVDLNSPEIVPDATGTITDPNDQNNPKTTYRARFPIIDGNNLGTVNNLTTYVDQNQKQTIAGFSEVTPSTYNAGAIIAPNNNPVPMPVRWLYMLQDGELHPRDPKTTKIANASRSNPVVGRMAFWADDDTCKLNVNTASEGNFWDRPRAKTMTEVNLSTYFPAQNEFQMFPGHPAKDCLSTVFGSIWPVPQFLTYGTYSKLLPYYDLVPRVTSGAKYGSAGGTQPIAATSGIPYDSDRLYTSVDELMFTTNLSSNNTRLARNDPANTDGATAISPQFLETTRFFLTASNRAPEVTLFNTPRVSLWPEQAAPTGGSNAPLYRTAKDKLLAFCSTIPASSASSEEPFSYNFQRYNATQAGNGTYPPAPGLSSNDPQMDVATGTSGTRNMKLYGYIQNLLSAPVPGLGGGTANSGSGFPLKYGASATNQIITEMFDVIRAGVNTVVSGGNATPTYGYAQPRLTTGEGQVVPLQMTNGTQGFGRFSTIVEASLVFFRTNDPSIDLTNGKKATTPQPTHIGSFLMFQFFNPTPGMPTWSPDMQVEVSGMDGFALQGGVKMGFLGDATNVIDGVTGIVSTTNSTEFDGTVSQFYYDNSNNQTVPKIPVATNNGLDYSYPFINNAISCFLPPDQTTLTFSGGTIVVKIYNNPHPAGGKKYLMQTLTIPFQSFTSQLPQFNPLDGGPALPPPTTAPYYYNTNTIFTHRLVNNTDQLATDIEYDSPFTITGASVSGGTRGTGMIDEYDVVRSMIVDPKGPSAGDYRVIAALKNVNTANGQAFFTAHPFYSAKNLGPAVLNPGGTASDSLYNFNFATSLRMGTNPAFGALGFCRYTGPGGSGPWIFEPSPLPPNKRVANGPSIGKPAGYIGSQLRKSAYTGTLVFIPGSISTPTYERDAFPAVPAGMIQAQLQNNSNPHPGDWDTGFGILEDGPYINKPDEGNNANETSNQYATGNHDVTPYYDRGGWWTDTGTTYSPNRQISSAVAFGSLPTGIDQTTSGQIRPWQTLLFCPIPPAGIGANHPGAGTLGEGSKATRIGLLRPPYATIPDHYVLDLFTMPIVEPYAISEPLSSQGKVNMNYQIAPFSYIRRDTALQAVLKSSHLLAIPTSAAGGGYKEGGLYNFELRYTINPDETNGTLAAFEERFNPPEGEPGDLFHSASEICNVPLVPNITQLPGDTLPYPPEATEQAATYSNIVNWWNNFKITGDNAREEPYGDIYPRLTTKSNSFTVHVRVQTLKKSAASDPTTFVDPNDASASAFGKPKDIVTSEYRGSYQVERYVDPNVPYVGGPNPNSTTQPSFPDYATNFASGGNMDAAAPPISNFYKFHTISTKQF